MEILISSPKKSISKAYLRAKVQRSELQKFQLELSLLFSNTNPSESEEFHKNLITALLKKSFYDPGNFINTKGRNDLVIHNGPDSTSTVGVIIEVKSPSNKAEMVHVDNLNTKALQEIILYYLRERISKKNLEIKHLIITNVFEWFIFDAHVFEKLFATNAKLVSQFEKFESGQLGGNKTEFFYKEIARPVIENIGGNVAFCHFRLDTYESSTKASLDDAHGRKIIPLFKLLSPAHLLKLPFANDNNTLNRAFYTELLHIIGLTEFKEAGKRLIGRKAEPARDSGSILENAIDQLHSLDKISRLTNPNQFGKNTEERGYNIALELAITWVNRVIFLKLLEAQLLNYHKHDQSYSFLHVTKIKNFGDLNNLFFKVLATKPEERAPQITAAFSNIPYLNSSLFEPTEVEHATIFISNLSDSATIPLLSTTVLKTPNGTRRTGSLNAIEYLLSFLDAYDFGSSVDDPLHEENKPLINSAVLGLIFEKINGYRDGSFFTPGFVTMFMSRETIRRAVIQKFNRKYDWKCRTLDDVYDLITDRTEANRVINSLTICDPAVGSGHFLVSALNEILAIKSSLRILCDRNGQRLKEYTVEVENDELVVTDDEGEHLQYRPHNKESQRVQEALFHEKQTIIENCLFGVDLNPNSVKICRLRLWIELLKNAYYNANGVLETLPNIDINIKEGNSLISRFPLDSDLKKALKKNKITLTDYRSAVSAYRHAKDKAKKRELDELIQVIKRNFRSEISANDRRVIEFAGLQDKLKMIVFQGSLFEPSKKEVLARSKEIKQLEAQISKIRAEIETIRSNKIFENAFEWRFEFPEVLNDDGDYIGFDVCIGNPPWGAQLSPEALEHIKKVHDDIVIRMVDTFMFFLNLSISIKNNGGVVAQIVPDVLLYQIDNEAIREKILNTLQLHRAINLGDNIFEDVARACCIVIFSSDRSKPDTTVSNYRKNSGLQLESVVGNIVPTSLFNTLPNKIFATRNIDGYALLAKGDGTKLAALVDSDGIQRGVSPDLKEAFIVNDSIIKTSSLENEFIKPTVTGGRDICRYLAVPTTQKIIYTRAATLESSIPNIIKHVSSFSSKIKCTEVKNGNHPIWALHRARDVKIFEKPEKILGVITGDSINTSIDRNKLYPTDGLFVFASNGKYSNSFLVGLLNSRLMTYFYRLLSMEEGRALAQIKPSILNLLPVSKCFDPEMVKQVEEKVDTIVSLVESGSQVDPNNIEQIDQLVYRLYGMTKEEVAIVESAYTLLK
ncbi:Eco57I restriction-modification methylase domain-containing protein [Massilia sp. LC238]|uniref:DUF7149 domain-containing protein n=1 Tax=Massilia sp. LC238 TaxID=1502852 RepID=UPI0004E424E2|nr:N-6 DNA methylase [Massilia sp. LC238]KFC61905.1 type II restriction m6 adenine DNA methyltransferase, Alw26I/Eco31I/Esp3I family [Massilia sp. LC238]